MAVIGTFTASKAGGWMGTIRTLMLNAKVHLVPNDNRTSDAAPVFRVFVGASHVGDAWRARTTGETPRDYFRVRLDDPCLAEAMSAALFPSDSGTEARLFWNRYREER